MADGINQVVIAGALGADPELRTLNGGNSVLKMRVAVGESYKDKDGTWKERTEWVSVVVWGKRAESLSRFLSKGSKVTVLGSLRTTSTEKDGQKRYFTEVVSSNIVLGGSAKESQRNDSASFSAPAEVATETFNDDIPF